MKNQENDNISNIITKLHHLFFKIDKKLKTYWNFNLRDFRILSLGDYIHVTFMS